MPSAPLPAQRESLRSRPTDWQEFGGGAVTFARLCREAWAYRELIWIFGLRDLQVRYRQTLIGVAWAVLQPLAQMLVFMAMFGLLGTRPSSGEAPYPLVVLVGLLGWQLFAGTVAAGTACLVANQSLVTKVYFPRICLPLGTTVPPLMDLLVSLSLLALLLLWYWQPLPWTAWLAPGLLFGILLCSVTAATGLAALNALYRDVGFAVPFLLQIGFFLTPVIYETHALIPAGWRWLFFVNPLAGMLEGLRWSVLGTPCPTALEWSISCAGLLLLTWCSLRYFIRVDRFLADRI